jgi:hypothetical protein
MAGLSTQSGRFGLFYWQVLLTSWTGLFFAQVVAAVCPTQMVAIASYPIVLFVNLTFTGYVMYLPSFPSYLAYWGPYISFMRFSFQTLVVNELEDNSELPYGSLYLDTLGFTDLSKSQTSPILIIFLAFYGLIVLLSLKYINYENR